MPYFNSPSFYIDFSQVPAPNVVETITYETILSTYKTQVLAKNADLAQALGLEQSATNIILEAEAYGELILRARINAAARAVMLAFAIGSDLDNLAAFYNVIRATNTDGSPESDTRFRRRVQLAAEAFSTAGTAGSYIFHALDADPSIGDASAMKVDDRGGVKVTILNSLTTPVPTQAQLTNVLTRLNQPNIKVLTDVVKVSPPVVVPTSIDVDVSLYPGPDAGVVASNIQTALATLRNRVGRLGMSVERSAIYAAINQEGVQNIVLKSPTTDFTGQGDHFVSIQSATINILNNRTF